MFVACILIVLIRRIQSIIGPRSVLPTALRGIAVVGLCLGGAPFAGAQSQFVRLADLTTLVPGGAFHFAGDTTFSALAAPAIDGNTVVFVADTVPGLTEISGIFRTTATGGPVQELVTRRTWLPEYTGPRPGPSAPFNQGEGVFGGFGFSAMDFQDGRLAFMAATLPTPSGFEVDRNAYVVNASGSGLTHAYRASTGTIGNVAVAADRVVVHAIPVGTPVGLHRPVAVGNLTVVQSGDPFPAVLGVPGGTFFLGTIAPVEYTAYQGGVAFAALAGAHGNSIWRKNDTDPDFVLLRRGGASGAPAAPFPIAAVQRLRADTPGSLTFQGSSGGTAPQFGIFTQRTSSAWLRREFETIATTQMAAPSGFGNFKTFDMVAADSNVRMVGATGPRYLETDVAFAATDQSNQRSIYAYIDDQISTSGGGPRLQRVVGVGDTLDGKTITHVQIGRNAVSNGRIAFMARFSDGAEAIYTVPVQGLLPLSGVSATTSASVPSRVIDPMRTDLRPFQNASGSTSADASAKDEGTTGAAASSIAQGVASPVTGGLQVRAKAESAAGGEAFAGVNVTQQYLVLGAPGVLVRIDVDFTFTGGLGIIGDGSAAMTLESRVYSMGSAPATLFSGGVELNAAGPVRLGSYLGATGDIAVASVAFGNGSLATTGFEVTTDRDFPGVLMLPVGERWAIEYILTASTSSLSGAAIADFSRTLNAFASTTTEGASLAMIHTVPIPEPEQVVLMLCGLAILVARVRRTRRMR